MTILMMSLGCILSVGAVYALRYLPRPLSDGGTQLPVTKPASQSDNHVSGKPAMAGQVAGEESVVQEDAGARRPAATTGTGGAAANESAGGGQLRSAATLLDRTLGFLSPSDPDLNQRRQVYGHVADFLGERLGCAPAVARDVVHCLCGEQDQTLLAEGEPGDPALLAQARAILLVVRVEYLLKGSRQAQRVTTIAFLANGQPAQRHITNTLDWDLLPGEVRSERLRLGVSQVTFQLFPCGEAANS